LVDQNHPIAPMTSEVIQPETATESTRTSELSSFDQNSSEYTCPAGRSETSVLESCTSSDSDSSETDESTSSESDEETSEEDDDSSAGTSKVSDEIASPFKELSTLKIDVSSESDKNFITSTSNVESLYNTNHNVSQFEYWDDIKSIYNARSGSDSTQSDTSKSHESSPVVERIINDSKSHGTQKKPQIIQDTSSTASTSNTKSDTSVDESHLPSELAGGWGEEPDPAPWDWQAMPFDYMGILEEQRRTVFYELHEHDGKEEWTIPKYKGDFSHG
jgi:hypothetical protein